MGWQNYFKDKVVWVTGASSGMGEQLCYALDKYGARLILSARNEERLQRVVAGLGEAGKAAARILPLDLEQLSALPAKAAEAEALFGRVDILVNNAGLGIRDFALNTRMDVDERLMKINYFGAVALTKALLPGMIRRNYGHIAVVSSLSAKVGIPRTSAYAAPKHALHGFFDSLRSELDNPNIFITLLIPGIIQTEITAHALKGDGTTFGKVELSFQKAFPVDKAVLEMARAIAQKREEKFVGGSEGWLLAINRVSPALAKYIIRNHPLKRLRSLKQLFSAKKKDSST